MRSAEVPAPLTHTMHQKGSMGKAIQSEGKTGRATPAAQRLSPNGIMPRPFLCWVTSEAPATTSLTLSHTRHNSRWYLQAIHRAGERVICREQHQKARYTPCAVLAGEREVAGDIQVMPHIRRSILSTTC